MTTVIVIYITLLLVFFFVSSLIFRYTIQYSYLSPRFKTVVTVFSLLAVCVIAFSLYLLAGLLNFDLPNFNPTRGNTPSASGNLDF